MPDWTIYHNAECSKSNCALDLLRASGVEPRVVNYLSETPSKEDLTRVLAALDIPAEQLVRKSEALYKEKYAGLQMKENEWIRVMHEHPELIERPIVLKGDKAVIGRTVERLQQLLRNK